MHTETFMLYNQENKAVQDAYSMLTANIRLGEEAQALKSIVLTSCKPAAGKTALAINLAITMAGSGWKVLLVDTDMRKPKAAKRLSSESVDGLSDCLSGEVELQDAISKTNIINMDYLSCGKNCSNPVGLFCSANFEEFMYRVRDEYDFVIFDTPALSSVADASLISAKADAVLLVVQMGKTNLVTLKRSKEQLEKVNANILGVVLNKVKKREYRRYFESYNYFLDAKRFIKRRRAGSEKPVAAYNNCKEIWGAKYE